MQPNGIKDHGSRPQHLMSGHFHVETEVRLLDAVGGMAGRHPSGVSTSFVKGNLLSVVARNTYRCIRASTRAQLYRIHPANPALESYFLYVVGVLKPVIITVYHWLFARITRVRTGSANPFPLGIRCTRVEFSPQNVRNARIIPRYLLNRWTGLFPSIQIKSCTLEGTSHRHSSLSSNIEKEHGREDDEGDDGVDGNTRNVWGRGCFTHCLR